MLIKEHSFTNSLIHWYSIVKRDLPWRKTKDPYYIWLSEIILQQTRVDQGLPYYMRFVETFPTVHALSNAREQDVLKTWEGLGYYSRARNLHATARIVSRDLKGVFPDSYAGLLALKGIGPYTAAAISSIAFGEVVPVIDGNVFRFIARHYGVEKDVSDQKNRSFFDNILRQLIPKESPGAFNQAVMEYGATVCKPVPLCDQCLFSQSCFALKYKKQHVLPIKKTRVKVKELHIAYLLLEHDGHTLMRARKSSIWTGLYEFLNIESVSESGFDGVGQLIGDRPFELLAKSDPVKHLLSHRKLWVTFYRIRIEDAAHFKELGKDFKLKKFSWEEVLTLPRPKVIVNYLQKVVF